MTAKRIQARRAVTAALLALAIPAQAAAQSAAKPCLTETEVRAMMTFAMPSALGGLIDHCIPHLAADGFMRRNGAQVVASYSAGKQAAWPGAKRAFMKFSGGADAESAKLMAGLPDASLQPFVEGMIGGLIGSKLKPAQCTLADKMLRLLAPLPPANTVELLGTIVTLAGSDAKKAAPGGLAICKV